MHTSSSTTGKDATQSSSVPYALDIVDLEKSFVRQTRRSGYTTIKSSIFGALKSIFSRSAASAAEAAEVTKALQSFTMRVPRGASIGVIGRNGSGKSTLLKLVTGIYRPDAGYVRVNGRISALIELGAGFHPDFTGRENVYLAAVMHGLSRKEIDQRFSEIVAFAELEAVIDDPVRTYSSGMFMRLGFSVAIHVDPEVLLVDEVLSVGDAGFTAKCKERITKMRAAGKTLMLVSHDLDAVERWCDEVVWLHQGVIKDRGNPRRVIDHYRQFIERGEEQEIQAETALAQSPTTEVPSNAAEGQEPRKPERWGSREIEILRVELLNAKGEVHQLFHSSDAVTVRLHYQVHEQVRDIVFGIGIHRSDGVTVLGTNTDIERIPLPFPLNSSGSIDYCIKRLGLLDGEFSLDVAVHRKDGYPFDYRKGIARFVARAPHPQIGVFEPEHEWFIPDSANTSARRAL